VAEVGPGVEDVRVGERVVVGWFGGNCGHCSRCRPGQLIHCLNGQIASWHYPGGYAESVVVPATALARIPDEPSFVEAAPMSCAGVTTDNALRRTKAVAGDRVAVLGIGGLGHLGVQFARAMGFETVAVARGAGKEGRLRHDGGRQGPVPHGAHHGKRALSRGRSEAAEQLGFLRGELLVGEDAALMQPGE
jgi:alcohol dehydrogenase